MTLIAIDDAQLWVEEYGSGDEVVISSAMNFTGNGYVEQLAEAPTHYRVLTIQARGFGRSTRMAAPPEMGWLAQWADDVVSVANQLGIDTFNYTGASHGAGIGWYIAQRNPQRLKSLISVVGSPHDRAGDTSSSEGRRKVIEGRHDPAIVRAQMQILAGWTDDPERIAAREVMLDRIVKHQMSRDEDEAVINQGMPFPEAKTNDEVAAVLRTITVPVLNLAGMRDGIISPEASLRAAVNVRGAKTVLFEDEGHFIGSESPERLNREIKLFIDELNGVALPKRRDHASTDGSSTV